MIRWSDPYISDTDAGRVVYWGKPVNARGQPPHLMGVSPTGPVDASPISSVAEQWRRGVQPCRRAGERHRATRAGTDQRRCRHQSSRSSVADRVTRDRPAPGRSASRRSRASTRSATARACSSRSTARLRTSPERGPQLARGTGASVTRMLADRRACTASQLVDPLELVAEQEQVPALGTAEDAGEARQVSLDPVGDLAAVEHPDAGAGRSVRITGVCGERSAVWAQIAESASMQMPSGPSPSAHTRRPTSLPSSCDVERGQPSGERLGDDQGGAVGRHDHAVGEVDVAGDLAGGPVRCDKVDPAGLRCAAAEEVEVGAVDVDVAALDRRRSRCRLARSASPARRRARAG